MSLEWLPLESNPELLNNFLQTLGLPPNTVAFNDVFGLDEGVYAHHSKSHVLLAPS